MLCEQSRIPTRQCSPNDIVAGAALCGLSEDAEMAAVDCELGRADCELGGASEMSNALRRKSISFFFVADTTGHLIVRRLVLVLYMCMYTVLLYTSRCCKALLLLMLSLVQCNCGTAREATNDRAKRRSVRSSEPALRTSWSCSSRGCIYIVGCG